MAKITNVVTKSQFTTQKTAGNISDYQISFIDDTGEIYTHGKYFGGYITPETSDYVSILLNGSTYNISLYGHTHSILNNSLMVGGSASPIITLSLGDNDTGFKWVSDGIVQMYANSVAIGQWTSSGINWYYTPQINGTNIATSSDVSTAVSNIQVGGTNYINNGDFSQGLGHIGYWGDTGTICRVDSDSTFGNCLVTTKFGTSIENIIYNKIKSGDSIVLSFYAKSTTALTTHAQISNDDSSSIVFYGFNFTTSTSWQRFVYKGTAQFDLTTQHVFFYGSNTDSNLLYIADVQLEIGTNVSDYHKSIVDINGSITTAKSTAISTAASDATTKANNAISTAETYASTYYLQLVGGTLSGTLNSQSIIPTSSGTYNLGSSSYLYGTVYGSNFSGNAATASNASTLSGYSIAGTTNNGATWSYIPIVKSDGGLEIGYYIDFHASSNDGIDYATRLQIIASNTNIVTLPSATGTLALTSDNIASASIPYGFTGRNTSAGWGNSTLQSYTYITGWDYNGADIQFRDNAGQLNIGIDGFYWQNEGQYMCLDTNNYTSYLDSRYWLGSSVLPFGSTGVTNTGDLSFSAIPTGVSYYNHLIGATLGYFRAVLTAKDSTTGVQFSTYWCTDTGSTPSGAIYYRVKRDANTDWSNFVNILDAGNYTSYAAPVSHASSSSTYGLGTTSVYGHVSLINALTSSSYADGQALSAYQGYLLANGYALDNTKMPLSGGTFTGGIGFSNITTGIRGLNSTIADNDGWYIQGEGSGDNNGALRIGTYDDSNEPIMVSQGGSNSSYTRTAYLLDSSGNTSFPGIVTAPTFNGTLSGTASNATDAEYVGNDNSYMRFHWNGQGGQPTWLWGGNSPADMYVYNPANFNVNSAEYSTIIKPYASSANYQLGADTYLTAFYDWNNTTSLSTYFYGINLSSPDSNYNMELAYSIGDTYLHYRYTSGSTTWNSWRTLIDSTNISSQSVNYASSAGYAGYVSNYLTIQGNGTTISTYNGASFITANITPSNIGALALTGGTMSGDIIPDVTRTRSLGNSTYTFYYTYTQYLSGGGNIGVSSNLLPTSSSYCLGNSSNPWLYVDCQRLYTQSISLNNIFYNITTITGSMTSFNIDPSTNCTEIVFSGSSNCTIYLPPNAAIGTKYIITNMTSHSLTINGNGAQIYWPNGNHAATITFQYTYEIAEFFCINSSTWVFRKYST